MKTMYSTTETYTKVHYATPTTHLYSHSPTLPHPPTLTHTHPHPPSTHPHSSTLTHTYSRTLTHTYPPTTHPHSPTPTQHPPALIHTHPPILFKLKRGGLVSIVYPACWNASNWSWLLAFWSGHSANNKSATPLAMDTLYIYTYE